MVKEGIPGNLVTYKEGDFFGELALLNGESRAATVIAKSGMCGSCQCLTIKKAEFERLFKSELAENVLHAKHMEYFAMNKARRAWPSAAPPVIGPTAPSKSCARLAPAGQPYRRRERGRGGVEQLPHDDRPD